MMENKRYSIKTGYILALSTYVLWGIFPLYFRFLYDINSSEIVAWRIVWSVVFAFGLLVVWKHGNWFKNLFANPKYILWLFISSSLICSNWLTYIWAINNGHVLDASLGYYINPLVNVMLALCLLGERLRKTQWLAVILAAIGVLVQLVASGTLPKIALYLAFSFGFYGIIRKKIPTEALPGLAIETLLVLPFALIWLYFHHEVAVTDLDFWFSLSGILLVFTGPLTIIPLICFNTAAKILPYTTMGFMQYLAPTLLFLQAVFLFNEPINLSNLVSFAFIWAALIIYSLDIYFKNYKRTNV